MKHVRRLIVLFAVLAIVLTSRILFWPDVQAQQQFEWPEKAENLKQLPEDFPPDRLRAVMTGFANALGVRCSHCHVGEPNAPLTDYDFPSDDNPNKDIARSMLAMLGDINDELETMDLEGEERVNMWCDTCHRGRPKPRRLTDELSISFQEAGLDSAISQYRSLRARFYGRGSYDFGVGTLGDLGQGLIEREMYDEAITVFELNVEHFPESSRAYDNLAKGYSFAGDKELAIQNYEKSLELNPKNKNAEMRLEKLRAED